MAPKAAEALRRQKERKQKIVLIALAPVLLGLLAWQGPKTYSSLTAGAATPPPPVATTTPTSTLPTGTTSTPGSPTSPTGLSDSDPLLSPDTGQLIVFSRFVSKDPFRAKPTISVDEPSDQPSGAATGATIEVNGSSEALKVGGVFPASDGAFRLVSVGTDSAEIGLASGTFSNGQETMSLKVGEELVLISDPEGTRYAIKLISVE
jgi:hypothetical protein